MITKKNKVKTLDVKFGKRTFNKTIGIRLNPNLNLLFININSNNTQAIEIKVFA